MKDRHMLIDVALGRAKAERVGIEGEQINQDHRGSG